MPAMGQRLRRNAHTSPERLVTRAARAVSNELSIVIMGDSLLALCSLFVPCRTAKSFRVV